MVKKNEFVAKIAEKVDGLTKKDTAIILSALSEALIECLSEGGLGEKVNLPGIGSFKVKERASRSGRNPQTGEVMMFPSGIYAKFTPAKAFKDAIAEITVEEQE